MNRPLIPENAIGRVGMIAALHHVRGEDDGRLVAVRHPIGMVTELIGARMPVFAWQVLVLGEPVDVNANHCREIIVADKCLHPVSQLPDGEVERLVKLEARKDFDAALIDLAKILKTTDMTPDQFEVFVEKAANQAQIECALEVVSIAQVLREAGFKQENPPDGEGLKWAGVYSGKKLVISGGPDWFDHWRIWGQARDARTILCEERVLMTDWPRGRILGVLVEIWESAFGDAAVPDNFSMGVLYKQHQLDIRRLEPGLPYVAVDGEIFRATRRWIAQRHSLPENTMGPHRDFPISLSITGSLLQITVQGQTYGCPICRGWIDDCSVSLQQFLALPPQVFRGRMITLSFTVGEMLIKGCPVAVCHRPLVSC